jgi:hypothetical protein
MEGMEWRVGAFGSTMEGVERLPVVGPLTSARGRCPRPAARPAAWGSACGKERRADVIDPRRARRSVGGKMQGLSLHFLQYLHGESISTDSTVTVP